MAVSSEMYLESADLVKGFVSPCLFVQWFSRWPVPRCCEIVIDQKMHPKIDALMNSREGQLPFCVMPTPRHAKT